MILLFSVSVKGDLVPKKLWEFDFKEKTGKDLRQIYGWTGINYGRTGSVLFVAYSKRQENIETAYSFWVTSSGRVFEISELIRPSLIAPPSPEFSVLDMDYETLAVYDGKKIIRLEDRDGDLLIRTFNLINGISSNYDSIGKDGKTVLATKGNKILCYDPNNWIESEGENSEPQIRFSKITPNEVTIEGETEKGGTIERSTDLKNWKKLVKVNKGGFEVFVDPTEKNKEFFRVKSE